MDLAAAGVRLHYDKRCTTDSSTGTPRAGARPLPRGAWIIRTRWPAVPWRTTTSRRRLATFPPGVHEAAAVITYLAPGTAVLPEGASSRAARSRVSPHLRRGPDEPVNRSLEQFYDMAPHRSQRADIARRPGRALATAGVRGRLGRQLDPRRLHRVRLAGLGEEWMVVAVNYAENQSQCYIPLPFKDLGGKTGLPDGETSSARRPMNATATVWRRGAGSWTWSRWVITPSRSRKPG